MFPALALAFKLGVAAVTAAPVAGALVIGQPASAVLIEPLCATTDPVRFPCPAGVPTTIVVPTEDSPSWDCRYDGNGVCGVGHDPNHPDSWTVDGVPVDQATGVCAARVRSGFDCQPTTGR